MATYLKTPKTWAEARDVHQGARRRTDRQLGNKTWVGVRDGDRYAIRHWDTDIITFDKDGTITLDATKVSRTTAERMNVFTPDTVAITAYRVDSDEPSYVVRTPHGSHRLWEGETLDLVPQHLVDPVPEMVQRETGATFAQDEVGS